MFRPPNSTKHEGKTMSETPRGFRPDQSANEVHQALKSSLAAMEKAQRCAVLWFGDILERQLYRELGYSSIKQYAKMELGFSTSRTGDFLQLCRKLKKLPQVKAKVESGELGYTAARVIAPVADKTNEKAWVDFALQNSRRELEREVKRAKREAADLAAAQPSLLPVPQKRPAAVVPVRVSIEMSPTQFARYEKLWEQIRKQRHAPAEKIEALLEIMACYATGSSPRGDVSGAPAQIHIHQCPECEKTTVPTSRGELEIGQGEWERAACDCQTVRPHERNRASISPAIRRQVLARYRHRCQGQGCGRSHYLEVHHKISRARGGSNDPDNLTCLCSACHRLLHEKVAGVAGEPPATYRWGPMGRQLNRHFIFADGLGINAIHSDKSNKGMLCANSGFSFRS
jgi:5-methylcytosine-specific restriction endonuclease McrA